MKRLEIAAKGIIFDMDGVITNTMPYHFRAWRIVFKKILNLNVTHLDIYTKEGQPGTSCLKELFDKYKLQYNDKIGMKLLKDKEELFKQIVKTRFIPGARNFLKFLHKNHFKLALVTGTSRHELHKILPNNIYNIFDIAITGSDVKNGKPHPEPYLKAIRKLGLRKKEAVVIENAPCGITSAKRAGLKCLAIETSLSRKYLRNADIIFPSINDLRKKIRF